MSTGRVGLRSGTWIVVVAVVASILAVATVAVLAPPAAAALPVRPGSSGSPSSCMVGGSPEVPAYNPNNHDLYIPDENSANIEVLTPACTVVATIALPSMAGPSAIVYDPADHFLYAVDSYYGNVYVISGKVLKHTFPASKLDCPRTPFYDPAIGDVLVGAGCGSPELTELNGTSIVGHIGHAKIWSDPTNGVYDPNTKRILVAYDYGSNVTIYNPTTFKVLGTVGVSEGPNSIAYDANNHLDYVSCFDGNNVSIISSSGAGSLIGTVHVGSGPVNVAYSPTTLEIYVANSASGNVSRISGTTLKAPFALPGSFARPAGLVYDASNSKIYVTDSQNSEIDRV